MIMKTDDTFLIDLVNTLPRNVIDLTYPEFLMKINEDKIEEVYVYTHQSNNHTYAHCSAGGIQKFIACISNYVDEPIELFPRTLSEELIDFRKMFE